MGLSLLLGHHLAFAQQPAAAPQPSEPVKPPSAQAPAPQTPASAPASTKTGKKGAPALDRPDSSDGQFSLALFYWQSTLEPKIQNGHSATVGVNPANYNYAPTKVQGTPGAMLSVPAGPDSTLRFSFFRTQGHGDARASRDIVLYSTAYNKGDAITNSFTLQQGKVSWDYLSLPNPGELSKYRLKSLFEVQYLSIKSGFSAPTTDSTGAVSSNTATGTNNFIYPSLGLGLEVFLSKHVRFELQGSGFALPHRATLGDAEGQIAVRHHKWELLIGGKMLYFRTSPAKASYITANMPGAFVGIRWYPGAK